MLPIASGNELLVSLEEVVRFLVCMVIIVVVMIVVHVHFVIVHVLELKIHSRRRRRGMRKREFFHKIVWT